MWRQLLLTAGLLLLAGCALSEGESSEAAGQWCTTEDGCGLHDDDGPWFSALQRWALTAPQKSERQARIMALPQAHGYYVSERVDGPLLAPPPPPRAHKHPNHPQPSAARPYDEWQHSPPSPPNTGKIVNRPPNPYKDTFKPSYPAPVQNQPIPVHSVDRVDENRQPPQKQVSETDLYLLGAIEKLVFRADGFEKRLRKVEESVHYFVTGHESKEEPCAKNFTRMGLWCYHVSSEEANWKGASYACRRLKANMLEIDSDEERDQIASKLFVDKKHKGANFWTGGLNPGLLWIWSHSARPVSNNSSSAHSIEGEGRCLAWVSDPARGHSYRGEDCAARHRYICEQQEDKTKLSNEIQRVARAVWEKRKPKLLWTDDEP